MIHEIVMVLGGSVLAAPVMSRVPNVRETFTKRKQKKDHELIPGVENPTSIIASMVAARVLREPWEECVKTHNSWVCGAIRFVWDNYHDRASNLIINGVNIDLKKDEFSEINVACQKAIGFKNARKKQAEETARQEAALKGIENLMGLEPVSEKSNGKS